MNVYRGLLVNHHSSVLYSTCICFGLNRIIADRHMTPDHTPTQPCNIVLNGKRCVAEISGQAVKSLAQKVVPLRAGQTGQPHSQVSRPAREDAGSYAYRVSRRSKSLSTH